MTDATLWITVQKAARQLGITGSAVYAAIETRPLQKNVEWGRVLVLQSEIDRWRKERRDAARAVLAE